ncbi:MAG: TonB-dependent receptor [Endomicrobium sp.]|nr:TonB-dependent receptor [Endomicrobium sp.]
MKRILLVLLSLVFVSNAVLAQEEIFLTLTKTPTNLAELPTNVTVITHEEIESKHVETLGELLAQEMGVFYKTNGTAGDMPTIFMRGAANSARTLVLIDGRRVNDGSSGAANFTAISTLMIERIEIIRGAGSAVYGTGAFGGVINIITKTAKAKSPDANVGFSYGSDKTLNPYTAVQYYNDKAAVLLAGSAYQTEGYRKNSDYKGTNLLFNGALNLTDKQSISLSANSYDSDFGYPGSTIWLDPGRRKDHNEYIKADYNLNFDDKKLRLSIYHSDSSSYNDSTNLQDYGLGLIDYGDHSKTFNKTEGVQADFIWNSFLFGAESVNELYNTQNTIDGGITSGKLNVDKNRNTTAVYSQWNGVLGKFRIIPSIRYDYNSVYGGVFTPSISAVFNISQYFKLSANGGKVWRSPSFNDLYSQWGGNPNLKPEEGISGDIGFEFTTNKISAAVTSYYIDSDNLIISNANTNYIPENIDKAKQYGVEFGAGVIITKWLNINLNYTYLNAENNSKDYDGKILQYSPKHTINSYLNIKPLNNLTLSAVVSYKDKYYEDSGNTVENNGFAILDLNVHYKATDTLSFWIKGFNIANADYQIVNGYPMPGTTVYTGVDFKFWK